MKLKFCMRILLLLIVCITSKDSYSQLLFDDKIKCKAIGGGESYEKIIKKENADVIIDDNFVFTNYGDNKNVDYVRAFKDEIEKANNLNLGSTNYIIYIDDKKTITFNLSDIANEVTTTNEDGTITTTYTPKIIIKNNITIASGRGNNKSEGALLKLTEGKGCAFINIESDNARISGLRIYGPFFVPNPLEESGNIIIPTDTIDSWSFEGILLYGWKNNNIIDNNEIAGFTHSSIHLTNTSNTKIHHNYIHDNFYLGYDKKNKYYEHDYGYGVCLQGWDTTAKIYSNIFKNNKHSIAGTGHKGQKYTAEYNIFLDDAYLHCVDMHKQNEGGSNQQDWAGEQVVIKNNLFKISKVVPQHPEDRKKYIISIRGYPLADEGQKSIISNNKISDIIKTNDEYKLDKTINYTNNGKNLIIENNHYDKTNYSDLIVKENDGKLHFYNFNHQTFYDQINKKDVGSDFNFTHYFPGDWTGDGKTDLLVRTSNGKLLLYPFNGTFYGQNGGIDVGSNFNFANYFPGDWTGDGICDLLVRTSSGKLLLYPFNETFYDQGGGKVVGSGFNFSNYFVGKWIGNGSCDLIVRTSSGKLLLYPFNKTFYGQKDSGKQVGHGFNFTDYLIGNWHGDSTDDLIVRNKNGELRLFPFNKTFYGQTDGGKVIGNGFNFSHYFVGNWTGGGKSDLIVRDSSGSLFLYFLNSKKTFYHDKSGIQVGKGFHFDKYFVGNWD